MMIEHRFACQAKKLDEALVHMLHTGAGIKTIRTWNVRLISYRFMRRISGARHVDHECQLASTFESVMPLRN
jgi:hypothetical protein